MPSHGTANNQLPQDRGVGEGKRIVIFNLATPSAPALELRVNPKNVSFSYNNKVTTYQTRGAWVEEHWPFDELMEINGQVDTLSFSEWLPLSESLDVDELRQAVSQLLTTDAIETPYGWRTVAGPYRHGTPTGVNLHHTIQMFLNDGGLYDRRGIVTFHRGLLLVYDGNAYFGFLTNFGLNEDADRPYSMNWNFNFRVTFAINEVARDPFVAASSP